MIVKGVHVKGTVIKPVKVDPPDSFNNASYKLVAAYPTDIDYFEVSQMSLTLLLNLSLFMFIAARRNLIAKKSHQLFLNLQITHMLLAISIIISNFSYSPEELAAANSILIAMFMSLATVTLERMVAIKCPFIYAEVMTRHVIVIIILSWLPAILFFCLSRTLAMTQHIYTVISTVAIAVAWIALTVSNLTIYRVAKKHDRFVKENAANVPNTGANRKILKASYVCLAVVLSFVLLWFPFLVHNLIALAGLYVVEDSKVFTDVVEHIAFFNFVVDPILFVWLSRDTQKELKMQLKTSNCNNGNFKKTFSILRLISSSTSVRPMSS